MHAASVKGCKLSCQLSAFSNVFLKICCFYVPLCARHKMLPGCCQEDRNPFLARFKPPSTSWVLCLNSVLFLSISSSAWSLTLFAAVVSTVRCVSAAGRSRCASRARGCCVVMISVPGRLSERETCQRGQGVNLMSTSCVLAASLIFFFSAFAVVKPYFMTGFWKLWCAQARNPTQNQSINSHCVWGPATVSWNDDYWALMKRKAQTNSERTCCISSQLSEACNPRLPPFGWNH